MPKLKFKISYTSNDEGRPGKLRHSYTAESNGVDVYLDSCRDSFGKFLGYLIMVRFAGEDGVEIGCIKQGWKAKRQALHYVYHKIYAK